MVVRKSTEYQREFKPRRDNFFVPNFDYRLQRRQVEHAHHADAFIWEETTDESEEEMARPASAPVHKIKHDRLNQAYQRRVGRHAIKEQRNGHVDVDGEVNEAFSNLKVSSSVPKVKASREYEGEMFDQEIDEDPCSKHYRDQGVQTPTKEVKHRRVQTPDWEKVKHNMYGDVSEFKHRRVQTPDWEKVKDNKFLDISEDESESESNDSVKAPGIQY